MINHRAKRNAFRKWTFFFSLLLISTLLLAACGNNPIRDGAKGMKETLAELKMALDQNDAAKVKELGQKLEEKWKSFEDGVKEKSGDLYEKTERSLKTIGAGVEVTPLDAKTLKQAAEELDQALTEVEKL
ncbi:hypothetical protein [Thermicanus aegyptius]|uniref:hypothetical protein n=1 Tax=Thermicanus aegyptius TaxID=94009 RepID=UPI0003FBCB21|nr:hypothetical protein [Thermicanus aegyptius]